MLHNCEQISKILKHTTKPLETSFLGVAKYSNQFLVRQSACEGHEDGKVCINHHVRMKVLCTHLDDNSDLVIRESTVALSVYYSLSEQRSYFYNWIANLK